MTMPLPAPYRTQKWGYDVMRRALVLRSRGVSLRDTEARLKETMEVAPPWPTIQSWSNGTIKRAARIAMELPKAQAAPKTTVLVWRESGHLSAADAGLAVCGGHVRFHREVRTMNDVTACPMCVMLAERRGAEFTAAVAWRKAGTKELDLLQGVV